jgi:uncharacterized membrane protein
LPPDFVLTASLRRRENAPADAAMDDCYGGSLDELGFDRRGATRQDAQRRLDAVRIFQAEMAALEAAGVLVLTDAQRAALDAHHDALVATLTADFDVDRDAASKQLSLGMRIASFLGALAFAASVFFLFHQYWGRIGTAAQVGILLGASLASFWITAVIRSRDASGYFTKLAALVSFACFVLDVSMLGRIFNITPSDNALLVWGAMAFLLAYACDLRLLLAAALLCVLSFASARIGEWSGMYWLDFGERPENTLPAAAAIFAVPLFVSQRRYNGFASLYRLIGALAVFLPMLVLSFWGQASYLDWDPAIIQHCYQVAGFIVSAGAIWLGAKFGWPEIVNTGVAFFVVFLFTKFYDWWWDSMPKYLFFLVVGLTALLALIVLRRVRGGVPHIGGSR